MTSPLGGARSIHLSYRGMREHIVAVRTDGQKHKALLPTVEAVALDAGR